MLRQLSIRQFSEWRAYADLEPFDERRADLRAGSIVQTLTELLMPVTAWYTAKIGGSRRRSPVKLEDCTLSFEPRRDVQRTPEQARAEVMQTMGILMQIHNRPAKGKGKLPKAAKKKRAR